MKNLAAALVSVRKESDAKAKDYALPGISEEFRPLLSPVVMNAVLQRISKNIEVIRNHSLEIRRYYRTVEY